MAVGRQELCIWSGLCRAVVVAEERNNDERLHIVPGERSGRLNNPSSGKVAPIQASQIGAFAYLAYRL